MKLSICIPSVVGREDQFKVLLNEFRRQILSCNAEDSVELITDVDNKEVSIGAKRHRMYYACSGEYAVQIDDDDWIHENYVGLVLEALEEKPDCVGYKEHCVINGRTELSSFSLSHPRWQSRKRPDGQGFTHYRSPFTKTPIRTDLCQKVGVEDMRFAEDQDFAERIYPHLRKEVFIDEFMYYYTSKSLTKEQFNERYGITA